MLDDILNGVYRSTRICSYGTDFREETITYPFRQCDTGMRIDVKKRSFSVADKTGGLSESAIKPIALQMIWQICRAVSISVIEMGGIQSAEDALEFIMAGAAAVAVGTVTWWSR